MRTRLLSEPSEVLRGHVNVQGTLLHQRSCIGSSNLISLDSMLQ